MVQCDEGSYLSVGQQGVHSLKEARIQHIGLIHDKGDLFILATGATQHSTQILIEVLPGVFPVYLYNHKNSLYKHNYTKMGAGKLGNCAVPTLIW